MFRFTGFDSSSRTSVLFNDSHLAEDFVAALPRNVYQNFTVNPLFLIQLQQETLHRDLKPWLK